MKPIIPTVFAHNKKEFDERFKKLIRISKNLQIDYMDGKFVKTKSMPLSAIPNLKRYKINFEVHLMCEYPQKRIPKLKMLGVKKIIFHYKAVKNVEQVIQRARNNKLSTWLAINPDVPIKNILPYLSRLDGVLFMGVYPGKEKQSFVSCVYKKIKQLRKLNKKIKIQVDGGANEKTISKLVKAGVDYINSGSYISDSDNPMKAFKHLNNLFKK